MVTILFKEDINKNKELIEQIILNGGIIIYPTDTLYGIGGRADRDDVVKRIYELKRRDENKPLSMIIPDFNFINKYFIINDYTEKIIKKYLPGKFTILLSPHKSNSQIPISNKILSSTQKIGIRICEHYIQDIVFSLKVPLISTSANLSGNESVSKFEDIEIDLLKKVELVIVDDSLVGGTGSTVFEILENNCLKYIRK
ncbi:MAG: L-threonylcarbamoyladenylate synthase [Candidatus Woesearchaeota archaeon]